MSRIFISYAREDTAAARAIYTWLDRNGWQGDVFLDDHPEFGIAGGQAWRDALRNAAERCEVVITLILRSWLDSPMCWSEFEMAERFRKAILPVVLEGDLDYADIPGRITNGYQLLDRARSPDEEFHLRLRNALAQSGAGPESFLLAPGSHPYPGLGALTEAEAALFFGRDIEVMQVTEIVRDIRATARQRALVILGSSGSGKSSLLRAGLWPRLNRDDRNFLVLPVIRPGDAVLSGEAGLWRSLAQAMTDKRWARHIDPASPRTPVAIARAVGDDPAALGDVLDVICTAAGKARLNLAEAPPDIILPLDQAEELFNSDGRDQADRFLALLRPHLAAGGRFSVILTMRSDMIAQLQTDPRFPQDALRLFNLPPMPATSLPQVINGPAERLGLKVDPQLTAALLTDSRGADALPLLAFTLRVMFDGRLDADRLTLADYEGMGGARMAIGATAQKARAASLTRGLNPADYEALLRRSFIPHLVRINETGQPARRIARWSEFDPDCHPVLRDLADQRLLVTGVDGAEPTVEIAHEAVLREWPEVAALVMQHRDYLAWREQVSRLHAEYTAGRGDLLSGRSLAIAQGFAEEFGPGLAPGIRDFVTASKEADEAERRAREAERDRAVQIELDAAFARARDARRATRRIGAFALVALLLALGMGYAMWQANQATLRAEASAAEADAASTNALREAQGAQSLRLAAQAQDLINRVSLPAGRAIAWLALPHDPAMAERPISDEAARAIWRSGSEVLLEDPTTAVVTYAPAGPHVMLLARDNGRVRVLNTVTGQTVFDQVLRGWKGWHDYETPSDVDARPGAGYPPYPVFSADGEFLSVIQADSTAEIWQLSDGSPVGAATYDPTDLTVVLSKSGRMILRETADLRLLTIDLRKAPTPVELEQVVTNTAPDTDFTEKMSVDGLIEDPGGRYLWVVHRDDWKSYPIFTAHDARTGAAVFSDHTGNDGVLAISALDGRRLLICGLNNSTRIIDVDVAVAAFSATADPDQPRPGIRTVMAAEDGISVIPDPQWDDLGDSASSYSECAVSGDNRLAVLNFGDRLALFDLVTGEVQDVTGRFSPFLTSSIINYSSLQELSGGRIGPFGLNQDGSVIHGITGSASPTGDRALVFHDLRSGELIARIEPASRIVDYATDAAARTTVIETQDGAISVWDVSSGAKLADIPVPKPDDGNDSSYTSFQVQLTPSGQSLAVTVSTEDIGTEDGAETPPRHQATIHRLRPDTAQSVRSEDSYRTGLFREGLSEVILGTASGRAERRTTDGALVTQSQVHDGSLAHMQPAAGGIATAGRDGALVLLDPVTLTVIARAEAHAAPVTALAVAPGGGMLATGAQDGTLTLWPRGPEGPALALTAHETTVSDLLFTADGAALVSAGHDGRIQLHDTATGALLASVAGPGDPVWDLVAIAGSETILAAQGSGRVTAWNQPGAGLPVPRWTLDPGARVRVMAASPSGDQLALGLEDGRILLLADPAQANAPVAEGLQLLDGHRSAVLSLQFLGEGALLASLARDRTLWLWDMETGHQLAGWEVAGSTPLDLLSGPDGREVATIFADNLVELRRLPVTTLRDAIAEVGEALAIAPAVPFALCNQLRITGLPGADKICAPPR